MGIVSENPVGPIAKQVEERSLVVWYDPGADYKTVAERLEIPGTTIARYEGSFLKLRREIDPLLNDLEPPKLVVYVPVEQADTYHAPWVAADGAYAKRCFLRAAAEQGVIVVSRLRKDAHLRTLPQPLPGGKKRRGRPPKYGKQRIDLAKRAGRNAAGSRSAAPCMAKRSPRRTRRSWRRTRRPAASFAWCW